MTAPRLLLVVVACVGVSLAGTVGASERDALRRGEVVDAVVCTAEPELSYALYLPSDYTPERRWPALFALDARGRGAMVAELFRTAAERYGWIVVSSNDSASDAGWEAMAQPAAAILADAPRRVRIDPQRVYLAGFSGTARGAVAIAAHGAGTTAGVIAVGGGFPARLAPSPDLPFAFFGSAGTRDFNFHEMQALWDGLEAAGAAHRLAIFEGPHTWPPAEVAEQALGFFEVRAMVAGLRPVAAELVLAWAAEEEQRWRTAEEQGEVWTAWTGWKTLAGDLEGFEGEAIGQARARAKAEAERLAGSKELATARSQRRKLAIWEAERRKEVEALLIPLGNLEDLPPPKTRTRTERLIRSLRRVADDSEPPAEADAARRVLSFLGTHLSFYLPRDLFAQGEYQRAALSLELATVLQPESVRAWYDLGCARARIGQTEAALDALERALELGYSDGQHLRSDPDLESLRDDERFVALAAGLEKRPATAPGGADVPQSRP